MIGKESCPADCPAGKSRGTRQRSSSGGPGGGTTLLPAHRGLIRMPVPFLPRRSNDPMRLFQSSCTRRGFLGGLALGAVAFRVPGAFAEELVRTPPQTEG